MNCFDKTGIADRFTAAVEGVDTVSTALAKSDIVLDERPVIEPHEVGGYHVVHLACTDPGFRVEPQTGAFGQAGGHAQQTFCRSLCLGPVNEGADGPRRLYLSLADGRLVRGLVGEGRAKSEDVDMTLLQKKINP